MRFPILLVAAALAAFRPGPADAIAIGLNGNALGSAEAGERDDAVARGFGRWIALDGDRVLIGASGDTKDDPAELPFDRGFVFDTRNGKMLHRFDRPRSEERRVGEEGSCWVVQAD